MSFFGHQCDMMLLFFFFHFMSHSNWISLVGKKQKWPMTSCTWFRLKSWLCYNKASCCDYLPYFVDTVGGSLAGLAAPGKSCQHLKGPLLTTTSVSLLFHLRQAGLFCVFVFAFVLAVFVSKTKSCFLVHVCSTMPMVLPTDRQLLCLCQWVKTWFQKGRSKQWYLRLFYQYSK